MLRMEYRLGWCLALGVLFTLGASATRGAVPSETLLPETTDRFVSAPQFPKLVEQWQKTQLGELFRDPVMEPFLQDLRRQFEQRSTGWRQLVGLTVDDVRHLVTGEFALAQLRPADAKSPPATVLLADVSGNTDQAAAVLEKAAENLAQHGAKTTPMKVAGANLVVFELPKQEQTGSVERIALFLCDNVLGASDNSRALMAVLQRLRGQKGRSLASLPAFQAVMERVAQDAGSATPQLRWFARPFAEPKPPKAASAESKSRKNQSTRERLEELGFSAVQGIGGRVDLAVDNYQVVHRTMIYAPKPYAKVMEMLLLPNSESLPTPAWVPRDVASCTTVSLDTLHVFDHLGPLVGAMYPDGDDKIWEDVLAGLRDPTDPNGPHFDLRKELAEKLGNRAHLLTSNVLPIGPTSERLLVAIPTQEPEAVALAVEKLMKNDTLFEPHPQGKLVIWEMVPPKPNKPKVTLEAPGSEEAGPRRVQRRNQEPLFPQAALTVAHGHLLVASHRDFLLEVLGQTDERTSLPSTVEYRQVTEALQKLGASSNAVRDFGRLDEQLSSAYELMRQGQLPQSKSLFGRLLNSLQRSHEPGKEPTQQIDGSQMPDYGTVRRYLGPDGAWATSEPNGWFVKGVLLSK